MLARNHWGRIDRARPQWLSRCREPIAMSRTRTVRSKDRHRSW
jgi:hypothetical protein